MIIDFSYLKEKYNMKIEGIIHVGAHYGEEIPDYIKGGIKNIVLFEPLQSNFSVLSERTMYLQENIELHKVALGSTNEKKTMYVSDNEKQSSSILKPKVHLWHHPNVNFPSIEEVDVNTLDDYGYKKYNLLCMDVQGYELEVLKGSLETLKHIDYVYCEVNRDELYEGNAYIEEIDDFLSQYGMSRVETEWGGGIWGDAFYIKNNTYTPSETCQIFDLKSIYQKYFGYPSNGFFVEVGAFDGTTFSNTCCLADNGWKGIYIEPVEEYYFQCIERHKNNDVITIQCCIGSEQKQSDIYVSGGLTTTNKKMLEIYSEIDWSKDNIFYQDKCNQLRLDTIFYSFSVKPNFDLLVVDVEGNEEDVFNSFDLEYWSPKMMIVELIDDHESFKKYDDHVRINKDLRNKIINHGYIEIYKDKINTVFVKKNDINELSGIYR